MSNAKRRHRRELLSVLEARALQLWMRQTLREMHKSPYLREGEWERMLAAYEACFPGQRGPDRCCKK